MKRWPVWSGRGKANRITMENKNFTWNQNGPAPHSRRHSLKKLDVIEQYVRLYLKTLASNPRIDRIVLYLVDTFCGGGIYRNPANRQIELGSPLRLLQVVRATEAELNQERRKQFRIHAKFFFSDTAEDHVDFLKSELRKSPFSEDVGKSINVTRKDSSNALENVVSRIRTESRKARSLFVLDQCGYKDVSMKDIHMILQRLENAEIILTFSIDALLNFLTEKQPPTETLQQFGVNTDFIRSWRSLSRNDREGRACAQRFLMNNLHTSSNAQFFTPFLLFSPGENRTIMLAHLSRHQRARDKMLGVHWDQQNSFCHYGSGGLYQLGYDMRKLDYDDGLFSFRQEDKHAMREQLENELPGRLFRVVSGSSVTVEEFLRAVGNETAARNDDILDVLRQMAARRDIEIQGTDGKVRRPRAKPSLGDRLIQPPQRKLVFDGGRRR